MARRRLATPRSRSSPRDRTEPSRPPVCNSAGRPSATIAWPREAGGMASTHCHSAGVRAMRASRRHPPACLCASADAGVLRRDQFTVTPAFKSIGDLPSIRLSLNHLDKVGSPVYTGPSLTRKLHGDMETLAAARVSSRLTRNEDGGHPASCSTWWAGCRKVPCRIHGQTA